MKYVNLTYLRANFDDLLGEVERGETLVITLGGPEMRTVRRAVDEESEERRRQSMRDLRELKKGAGIATIEEILAWRDDSRKEVRIRASDVPLVNPFYAPTRERR